MMFCLAINNKNFDDEKVTQVGMMQLIHTPKKCLAEHPTPIIGRSQSRAHIFKDIILQNMIERVATLPKAGGELLNQLMQKCIIRSADHQGQRLPKLKIWLQKRASQQQSFGCVLFTCTFVQYATD